VSIESLSAAVPKGKGRGATARSGYFLVRAYIRRFNTTTRSSGPTPSHTLCAAAGSACREKSMKSNCDMFLSIAKDCRNGRWTAGS
jgi:hypothetical protein